jgi:uncharacterized protein (TIGR00162 family)
MEWVFSLATKSKPSLENPILIEGLPGIGNVGKIAVDFMVEKLNAKKLYTIYSHHIPHSVFVNEDNIVEFPKLEIYYKKFKNKRDLLILSGDTQPIDEPSCFSFCERLIHVVNQYHCKEIITLGGIGLKELPKEPRVFITGSSKEIIKKYKTPKLEENLYGHVGPIVGVTGVLVAMAKLKKLDAISLLGETLGHPMFIGIKPAKKILEYMNDTFDYNLKLKYLDQEIKDMETELKIVDEMEALHIPQEIEEGVGTTKKGKKKGHVSYIG